MGAKMSAYQGRLVLPGPILAVFVGVAQALGYDLSTPERALASLQEAFRQRDAAGIAEATYFPGSEQVMSGEAKRESIAQWKNDQFETFASLLCHVSECQVDLVLPFTIRQKLGQVNAPFTEAARIVCRLQITPELPFPPELEHVVALYFVHRDNRWQWYLDPYLWWNHWTYDCSTPEKACRSVMQAIGHGDVTGVYDMIDPEMLVGIDRETFLRITRDRLEQIDRWQAAEDAARKQAREQRIRPQKRTAPPFVAQARYWAISNIEVEQSVQDAIEVARIWRRSSTGERLGFEDYVKRDNHWRWRPKREYTVWFGFPATTQPQSQPADP